jgi:hypothetical protein
MAHRQLNFVAQRIQSGHVDELIGVPGGAFEIILMKRNFIQHVHGGMRRQVVDKLLEKMVVNGLRVAGTRTGHDPNPGGVGAQHSVPLVAVWSQWQGIQTLTQRHNVKRHALGYNGAGTSAKQIRFVPKLVPNHWELGIGLLVGPFNQIGKTISAVPGVVRGSPCFGIQTKHDVDVGGCGKSIDATPRGQVEGSGGSLDGDIFLLSIGVGGVAIATIGADAFLKWGRWYR